MKVKKFSKQNFAECLTFKSIGDKYSAGQITIIGGSKLFHGAPILALKAASRMVSMTYFSSPLEDKYVAEKIKAGLSSFVWVDREDIGAYVAKSDAVLVGPGLMRSHVKNMGFSCDSEGEETRRMSVDLFKKYPEKKWVVDGGTLQVVRVSDIPKGAVVTPNKKEFEMLFGEKLKDDFKERCNQVLNLARKYEIVLLTKDDVSVASDGSEVWAIEGGNQGLVKGGVGDVIAGLTVGLMAKNDPLFSVCAASYLSKKAAERLAEKRGYMFNSDDLVDMVPKIFGEIAASRVRDSQ
jgi:NAD(P)H-hydrate epimerase